MNVIASRIRQYRKDHDASRAAVAAKMGLSEAQLKLLEERESLPTVPTLKRVAVFFGLTPAEVGQFVLDSSGTPCGRRPKVRRHIRPAAA